MQAQILLVQICDVLGGLKPLNLLLLLLQPLLVLLLFLIHLVLEKAGVHRWRFVVAVNEVDGSHLREGQ